MTYLGSLKGAGRIRVNGQDTGPARYEFRVYESQSIKRADGTITADDTVFGTAMQGSDVKEVVLVLENGETAKIHISQWNVMSGRATVMINGRIPGY